MRVISGKYKGKKLDGFGIPGTRPTMDRVKESLFGSIQNHIKDSIVLDLFAGTGSLGIEALSNGAQKCFFVDSSLAIEKALKRNLDGIENAYLLAMDYQLALQRLKKDKVKFHLVFLDPPYHLNLLNAAIRKIESLDLLEKGALIVCEFDSEVPIVDGNKYTLKKAKKYGDKNIFIYKFE